MPINPSASARYENRAFLALHGSMLVIVLIGFGRSYYLRDWFIHEPLDVALRTHGLFLTCWFGLTVVQSCLVQFGRRRLHRKMAWFAGVIALGVVVSAVWINTRLALQVSSPKDPINAFIWGNYLTLIAFIALLSAAFVSRRDAPWHRRLIALSSIIIIGPAFARFAFWPIFGYGVAGGPLFAIGGMLLLLSLMIGSDLATLHKVHAATTVGMATVVVSLALGVWFGISEVGFNMLHRVSAT
jgi:hypothetical protein